MELNNNKLLTKKYDYSKPLSEEEEKDLIKNFNKLKFIVPKIDSLFKQIFGNPENKDVAVSLIKAVLPDEEEIGELDFLNVVIYYLNGYDSYTRGFRIDIYVKDTTFNKNYIIEMQIHEIKDAIGRSELTALRILDSLYKKRDLIELNDKIYCINFLYYDQYPKDKNYYHYLFTHEFNKKDISLPFKNIIVIELKKFKQQFEVSQIEEELLNGHIDRKIERQLWFAFLSFINTLYYHEPKSIDSNKYFKIERERKNVQNVNENEKKDKIVIYIKNEIDEKLCKFLIKVGSIRKALDLCINLSESKIDEYIGNTEKDMEYLSQLKEKDEIINKNNEEINKRNEKIKKKK